MNFKQWLLSEELYPNKTAVVYHRTKSKKYISNILISGFQAGEGAMYGKGLYTTFALESQFHNYMANYGNFVVKFKVTDLDKYLICQLSVAKYILGNDYSISSQFKKFNIKATKQQLNRYDNIQIKSKFSSDVAYLIYANHNDITSKCKGIIFRGQHDGYVLVKYEPVNDATITMLGYAEADTYDDEKMNKLTQNQGWITSTDRAKIKSIYSLPSDDKNDYGEIEDNQTLKSFSLATPAVIAYLAKKNASQLNNISNNQMLDLIRKTSYKDEMAEAIINNKLNIPDEYLQIIIHDAKDKNKIVEAIIQNINKKEISDTLVYYLVIYAKNQNKMVEMILSKYPIINSNKIILIFYAVRDKNNFAELLGSKNINQLDDKDVNTLIDDAKNKKEIIELLLKYKSNITDENIHSFINSMPDTYKQEIIELILKYKSNITDENISKFIYSTPDRDKIAELIIKYKKELSDDDVFSLLKRVTNKDKIAELIVRKNKEISSKSIIILFEYTTDKDKIAELLGTDNISKLSYQEVYWAILSDGKNSKQIAQIFDKYHLNKTPKIKKLIKGYLS
jgi:predicted transposase YbfD/YdcC